MNQIEMICPNCSKKLLIPTQYQGQSGQCQNCGGKIQVPLPSKPENAQTIISFDLETTGLVPGPDRIVELAACKLNSNGEIYDVFQTLIKPGAPIPDDATEINGITDKMVRKGATIQEALGSFSQWVGGSAVLVAHNASFDAKFLAMTFGASGLAIPNEWRILDTLKWAKNSSKFTGRNYKLSTLAKKIGYNFEGAHRALADSQAVAALFKNLKAVEPINIVSESIPLQWFADLELSEEQYIYAEKYYGSVEASKMNQYTLGVCVVGPSCEAFHRFDKYIPYCYAFVIIVVLSIVGRSCFGLY